MYIVSLNRVGTRCFLHGTVHTAETDFYRERERAVINDRTIYTIINEKLQKYLIIIHFVIITDGSLQYRNPIYQKFNIYN